MAVFIPKGYFQVRRSGGGGGLDLTSSLEAKILVQVRPSSPNKRKKFGRFYITTRRKIWGKNHNFRVISEIQRAKFGVFVTYIFGGKIGATRISEANFGAKPPDLLI